MESDSTVQKVLQAAVVQVLRPLFRVLLRHSMSFVAFEDLAKRVYVEVAMKDFGIEGKKSTMSRASILSGLTRKEVQRLLAEPLAHGSETGERYNRAARVLTGWVRDVAFLAVDGQPRPLELTGEAGFAALVRRYSGDMPVRAVLDELVHVGAVRRRDDGRVELLTPAYVPARSPVDKLAILGSDVADLIDTIDHNIRFGTGDPRFQRKVMYHSIPSDVLPAFRKLSTTHAQNLLERLDGWLEEHDTDIPPDGSGPSRCRVGMGIHYFEEPVAPALTEGDLP